MERENEGIAWLILTQLHLPISGHNQVRHLPKTLQSCSSLRIIHIGSNAFSRFPEVVNLLPSLEELDLSGNTIPYLPRDISKMENRLVKCDLSKNLLRAVPPDFEKFCRKVKNVCIDNNPWYDLPEKWNTRWVRGLRAGMDVRDGGY